MNVLIELLWKGYLDLGTPIYNSMTENRIPRPRNAPIRWVVEDLVYDYINDL